MRCGSGRHFGWLALSDLMMLAPFVVTGGKDEPWSEGLELALRSGLKSTI